MKNLLVRFGKLRLVSCLLALGLISAGLVTLFASKAALKFTSEPQQATPATQKDKRPNRLIEEKSPYLLQHAYNPVDWFPWGEAAFEKARKENKLIFLSIGYSTCFWCHQMGRHVFENEELAAMMNRYFVSIKVDREFGEKEALQMTLETLRAMAESGMYDHIGGGFHRYSVDGQWRVPHFEKMLYDQAQLVSSYLDAYQITRDELYASIARETLGYVVREMTGKEGGFYSAEDAESAVDPQKPKEKEEGAFYVWTKGEIDSALGKEWAEVFNYVYGAQAGGNALADPHSVFVGKNILYLAHPINDTAKQFKKSPAEVTKLLAESRAKLFAARSQRPRPHLDDKILVSWNGLMISAFARAAQSLGDPGYLQAAQRSAEFILGKLYDPRAKRLLRRYRAGEARYEANLEDYAFFTMGLLDLYETSPDVRWLKLAVELTERQNALLYDSKQGGFFDATGKDATLLFRTKEDYDGAEPAGNSIAMLNLLRLAQMTDNRKWREMADRALALFSGRLNEFPQAMPQMLAALDYHLDKPKQIIIAGQRGKEDTEKMLREAHARYLPNKIILLADGGEGQQFLNQYLPFIETVKMRGGKATAYICENYACKLPTSDLSVMAKLLETEEKK